MKTTAKKSFNTRAFVVLTASITGFGLPITGLANHLLQQGPLAVPRHTWMAAHNVLERYVLPGWPEEGLCR